MKKKVVEEVPEREITFEGAPGDLERISTGLFSFDRAIGGGLPLRAVLELSGYEYSGKSTLAYYLCGLPNLKGRVGIADLEGCDPAYIKTVMRRSGFRGSIKFMDFATKDNKPIDSEKQLQQLADTLYEQGISAILLDSIGALYPVSEEEGKIGEARVGRRAAVMAPFMRMIVQRMRARLEPSIAILTNHVHQEIGGQGTITSGGKAVHYLSVNRVRLFSNKEDGYWVVNGKIVKRRYASMADHPGSFQVVLIPGYGIHSGLSAVQDCITYGLAEKEKVVKLNGKSYGYLKRMVEDPENQELFLPFVEALKGL